MLRSACSRTFFLGAYKCDLCTACTSPVLKQSLSQRCNLGVRYTGVKSGIKQEMCSSTRATIRMEEQMTSMMEKLEEQSQQIKCLTEKQSAQLEDMERRQQQMEKYVTALMEEKGHPMIMSRMKC